MAKKTWREHLQSDLVRHKKYFYALRPLLAARWIREGRGVPPMRFAALATATLTDAVVLGEINVLLAIKMRAGEAATSPRWTRLHDFIEAELAKATQHLPHGANRADRQQLDAYLHEAVLHFNAPA